MSFLLQSSVTPSLARSCVNFTKQLTVKRQLLPVSCFSSRRTESTLPSISKTWIPIYRLPLITWAASFNKLKVYQTFVTAVGVPAAYALEQAGLVASGSNTVVAIAGVTGIITLTLFSFGPQNLIGFIYINEQQDRIKLAYLDFWGRRQETETAVDDIMPENEQERPSRYDFYKNICLYSEPKKKYKLLQRFGVILEPQTFVELVGDS